MPMKVVRLRVPDITCDHCVMAIRREVTKLEGVAKVDGNPQEKWIAVAFDPAKVRMEQIEAGIREAGYTPEGALA